MKKNYNLFFILVTLLAFSVSCAKSELDGGEGSPVEEEKVIPPDAEAINFSISLSSEEEGKATIASGKVTWDEGDQVTVYGMNSEGVTQSQTVTVSIVPGDNTKANIVTTELSPGQTYYAVFPKCTNAVIADDIITVPEPAAATAQTNFNNQVAVAKAVKIDGGYSLQFRNVNHLLKFTVSETLAKTVKSAELVSQTSSGAVSYKQVSFNFGEGTSKFAGTGVTSVKRTVVEGDNYIALAPGMTMSDGFCLKLKDSAGKVVKLFFLDSEFTTKRNGVSNISNFETRLYTNLSKDETANCYLINPADGNKFCFDATVKGNGVVVKEMKGGFLNPELSTDDVKHLWSTFNTTTAPTSTSEIISNLIYHKVGFASFDRVSTGNVIVAAKNSSGTIIWSWHLWLPIDKVENVVHNKTGVTLNGTNMLNANLGALKTDYETGNTRDFGFFYQWGRKDPFVSAAMSNRAPGTSGIEYAKVKGTGITRKPKGPKGNNVDEINTLTYVIQNPTHFICSASASGSSGYEYGNNYKDWYGTTHYKMWAVHKTMYDPCPPGYKVPRVLQGPWGYFTDNAPWNKTGKGRRFTNKAGKIIWHPAAGFLHRCTGKYSGSVASIGVNGGYWGTDDNDTSIEPEPDQGFKYYNKYWYFDSEGCAFKDDTLLEPGENDNINASRATGRSVRCCRADEFL